MKKLAYSILFVATVAITFQSCDSDDDNNNGGVTINNQVSIGGTVYELDGLGTLDSFGGNPDGSFDWDVEFLSADDNTLVYFDLNTNSADGLVAGTYSYASEREEFTFVFSEIFVNNTFDYTPMEGTVVIEIEGETTSFTFNLTAQDGTDIAGQWSGILISVD
ncbi:hypothetical protein [uncultured Winogradskyella sp.]|uniref:hypothetical protein n=1 Tax=uncultured Winogradskyella sp. TaxID=395353 RepID=UPI002607ABD4|nr:hypothetical protein [uncultured Winogradskyella sp.]